MAKTEFHLDPPLVEAWDASRPPRLGLGDVHLWRASLSLDSWDLERVSDNLSAAERARARRFRFPGDRQRWAAGRGILRDILARYLDRPAGAIRFRYGPRGKPCLDSEHHVSDLRFNLSHSSDLAVFALTRGREIGVDLERVRADALNDAVASRWFSPRERDAMRALSASLGAEAFFFFWTRKEARLKADGQGWVEARRSEPTPSRAIEDDGVNPPGWTVVTSRPAHGFVGALAVRGGPPDVRRFDWGSGLDRPLAFETSSSGDCAADAAT